MDYRVKKISHNLKLWRLFDQRYSPLDGSGASLIGGRWNSPGNPVIYASMTYSTALLEKIVHLGKSSIPKGQYYCKLTMPENISSEKIFVNDISIWSSDVFLQTRKIGDKWKRENRSLILLVPSIVAMGLDYNALINPSHPEFFKIIVSNPKHVYFDQRLFK